MVYYPKKTPQLFCQNEILLISNSTHNMLFKQLPPLRIGVILYPRENIERCEVENDYAFQPHHYANGCMV
jgi:hypothetical protein